MSDEVSKEKYKTAMAAAMLGVIQDAQRAVKLGNIRNVGEALEALNQVFEMCWDTAQPGVLVDVIDLGHVIDELSPQLRGHTQEVKFWLFHKDRKPLSSFVEGTTSTEHNLTEHDIEVINAAVLTAVAEHPDIDVDNGKLELLLKAKKEEASGMHKRVSKALTSMIDAEAERKVAEFRSEINSKLDTMFGGGES